MDEAFEISKCGLGVKYLPTFGNSIMTLEMHVSYLKEILREDSIIARVRFIKVDSKRLSTYTELVKEDDLSVCAVAEAVHIHVNMSTRRSSPWPAEIKANLDRIQRQHQCLPWPTTTYAGRCIKSNL